jgi:hypothetical protein
VLLIQGFIAARFRPKEIPCSAFLKAFEKREVVEDAISEGKLVGRMKVTEGGETKEVPFAASRVDPVLSQKLDEYGMTFRGQPEGTFLRDMLSRVLPVPLLFGIWRLLLADGGDRVRRSWPSARTGRSTTPRRRSRRARASSSPRRARRPPAPSSSTSSTQSPRRGGP